MCNKMSDVRLSNASPTLERVDPRQPDTVRPPVRRSLFGRPDPEELRRNVAALVREDVQAFIERYNFDPAEERPLAPRNFEWEADGDAPEFYRRPTRARRDVGPAGGDTGQDAADRSGRRRGAAALAPCPSDGQSKRSRTDGDGDDEDDENQAVEASEDGPGRTQGSAEVR